MLSTRDLETKLFIADNLDASHQYLMQQKVTGFLKLYLWQKHPSGICDWNLIKSHLYQLPSEAQIRTLLFIFGKIASGDLSLSIEELYSEFVMASNVSVAISSAKVSTSKYIMCAALSFSVATEENMKKVANIDNSKTITDKKHMIRSMTVLGLVILGFMLHDLTHIDTYVVAMIGASILLLFEKPTEILEKVEWNTIFFFVGLFIIIGGLEASGGIKLMAEWLLKVTNGSQEATSMMILWGSGIISGIIDNIPYTATMSPMLVEIQKILDCYQFSLSPLPFTRIFCAF